MDIAVVSTFYQVYNEHRLDLLDELLDPSYIGHVNGQEIVGVNSARAFIQSFLTAFPDVQYSVDDMVIGDERVVARWTATATHQGSFAGMAPTGKHVNMAGITIFSLQGGVITELWAAWDVLGVLRQIQT